MLIAGAAHWRCTANSYHLVVEPEFCEGLRGIRLAALMVQGAASRNPNVRCQGMYVVLRRVTYVRLQVNVRVRNVREPRVHLKVVHVPHSHWEAGVGCVQLRLRVTLRARVIFGLGGERSRGTRNE